MPESPRFLLINDRHEEAAKNLKRLHTPEEAELELEQISHQMQIDRTLPSSYWAMITKPSYRKRTLLVSPAQPVAFSQMLTHLRREVPWSDLRHPIFRYV